MMVSGDFCQHDWPGSGCDECSSETFEAGILRSDNEVLRKITRLNQVGWISPFGEVTIVDYYRHLDEIGKKIKWVADILAALEEELNQAMDDHVAHLSEDDHPEWHTYEIWADGHRYDVQQDIYKRLYKLGWVRFGTYISKDARTIAFQFDDRFRTGTQRDLRLSQS